MIITRDILEVFKKWTTSASPKASEIDEQHIEALCRFFIADTLI